MIVFRIACLGGRPCRYGKYRTEAGCPSVLQWELALGVHWQWDKETASAHCLASSGVFSSSWEGQLECFLSSHWCPCLLGGSHLLILLYCLLDLLFCPGVLLCWWFLLQVSLLHGVGFSIFEGHQHMIVCSLV